MKVRQSLSHKAVILSLSKLFIELKNFFYRNCSVWYVISECCLKSYSLAVNWSNSSHFVTFRTKHQIKKFFTKGVQFGNLFENAIKIVKVMLSFGLKAVILSLSKLNIESKNFCCKSCSVWYAFWECHIKREIYDLLYDTCYLYVFIWNLLLLAKTCSFRSLLYVS